MCRLLGVLSHEPVPLRRYVTDSPHGLLAVSLRGSKAPHRDGVGWAYRDARGRMRLHRWGRETLARCVGLPGDLSPETALVVGHARKASPEYGTLVGAIHAQPLVRDGVFLAHNGTIRDVGALGEATGTDSQRLLDWLCYAWQPRTTERLAGVLRELLGVVRDYTAINLLLTDGVFLCGFCCYTRDPDYYTVHWRRGDGVVVVASEPTDGQPGWRRLANGEMLVVGPDLTGSVTAVGS